MTKATTIIKASPEYITVKEFGDATNRSPKTVRRLISNGSITGVVKTTKELLIHRSKVQLFFRPYKLDA